MRLLLVDDHGLFRHSMAVWLKQLGDDITIDFADSFNSTNKAVQQGGYDLILMDLGMPGMQGAMSVKYFCTIANSTPVVIVSADETSMTITSCINAGASGYVTKLSDGKTILQAIKQVLSGSKYIPVNIHSHLPPILSNKQRLILNLIIDGCSNKLISDQLHLTEGTVKQYDSQLLTIFNVDNRTQVAKKSREIFGIGNI